MAELLTDSGRWTVSVRSSGGVLAVRVGEGGLQMGFVGCPAGLQASEIQGWLGELIGMAAASPDPAAPGPETAPSPPIPRSLHQALTGLLFLQAEVWGNPADRIPMTLVVVEWGDRVAFGWSGSGRVTLVRSGEPSEPAWTIVRDDVGREARALVADSAGPLSVRAVWSAAGSGGESLEGVLEAEWPGRQEAVAEAEDEPLEDEPLEDEAQADSREVDAGAPTHPAAEAAPDTAASPRSAARPRPFWHFRSWMDKLAESPSKPEETAAPLVPPGMEPRAGESDAPLPLSDSDLEPIAHDVPGVPDLLPEPPAVEALPIAQPPAGRIEAELPEMEPPPTEAIESEPSAGDPPVIEEPTAEAPIELAAEPGREPEALFESPSPAAATRRVRARRLEWPAEEEPRRLGRLHWRRSWTIAVVVLGLFALGWVLGRVDVPAAGKAIGSAFKAIGLGPAHCEVTVTSRPAGAWISVDGVDQARRTPATLAVKPGRHEITLSFSGEGGSSHSVTGRRGERVALDVALWGGLRIDAPPGSVPLSVTVDGTPRGYAPLVMDRLQPGIHRLQFSGPGVAPWEQTVEVHVDRTAGVLAQPVVSPPTGVLEVRATLADDTGSEPLAGAAVRIDGQSRGVTPLRLELPRGPHSIRVSYRGDEAPVQVIDLPGGNQRFATLDLGLAMDGPRLSAGLQGRVALRPPTVLSATLDRAREGDVREMWLHVRTPEGAWRRYAMSVMKAPGGLVGAVVFPTDLFDRRGRTSWYASALAPTGDEYFTEIQPAQAAAK
jgi:hypothetical protein